MRFKESATAHAFLDGLDGIEIGASAHNPFGLRTRNVDRYPHPLPDGSTTVFKRAEIDTLKMHPETPPFDPAPVDIVAPGDALPLATASQDFVLSSHVLEHFFDPLAALEEWARVVRDGGYVFTIVPKRDALPSDVGRPVTPMGELLRRNAEPAPDDAEDDRHWTVFDTLLLGDVARWAGAVGLVLAAAIQEDDKVRNGWMMIMRKAAR